MSYFYFLDMLFLFILPMVQRFPVLSFGVYLCRHTPLRATYRLKYADFNPISSGAAFYLNWHNLSISFLFVFYFNYGSQFCAA